MSIVECVDPGSPCCWERAGYHSKEPELSCTAAAAAREAADSVGGNKRGGGGGLGGVDECAALCERRQEAAQHVRIQMPASPSHPHYWCTSTHSFNCVWPENICLLTGRSGRKAGVNAGVRHLYCECCSELLRTVQISSYTLLCCKMSSRRCICLS